MPLLYEPVIIENPNLARDLKTGLAFPENESFLEKIPDGVTDGVPPDVYNAYRKGCDSACTDIVFVTILPDGRPAVLLSFRKKGVCYGEKWWVYGGAIKSYCSIASFISDRAENECGVRSKPQALVGVYRTMSDDAIGSTLQPCYAAIVPYEKVREKQPLDSGHDNVRLFTLVELEQIPSKNKHWYPMQVANLVLRALQQKDRPTEVEKMVRGLNGLLHRLWTKAVGTPGYSKEEWLELDRNLWSLVDGGDTTRYYERRIKVLNLITLQRLLFQKAVETPDYSAEEWTEFERGIWSFMEKI